MSRVSTDSPAPNRRVLGDTIALHNAKASDSAVYQCEASNRHGTLLSNANIMIMSKYDYLWSHSLSFVIISCQLCCIVWLLDFTARIIQRHLTDAWNLVLMLPIKEWGAEEGVLPAVHTPSFRLVLLPTEQQAQFSAIYMLTSFPSIPYGNQGHKTNMCCFTSADKKRQDVTFSCFAHI